MCRWMAWLGQPLLIEELLFKSQHGIVDQSVQGRRVGLGWHGSGSGPADYRSVSPAWADPNLRELAAHVEAPLSRWRWPGARSTRASGRSCGPGMS